MKKNLLVTLGICAGLMLTACPKEDTPPVVEPNVVDVRITTLLGEDHKVPKIPEATDWAASIVKATEDGSMGVYAYCTDVVDTAGKGLAEVFAATLTADVNWNQVNNETSTVEASGYLFGDGASLAASNVVINFFNDEDNPNEFVLYVVDQAKTYDGKPIGEDGHEVEWYEDFVAAGFEYETTNDLAVALVNEALGIEATKIPELKAGETGYVYSFFEADDEKGTPAAFSVIFPGDASDTLAFATKADEDGFVVRASKTIVGYEIDYETFTVGYKYATLYTIFDDSLTYVVQATDFADKGVVEFDFIAFEDVYAKTATTDTEWNESAAEVFASVGFELPFVALGEGYEGTAEYYEEYGCLCIMDNYYIDVTDAIGAALVTAGFKLDEDEESDYYGGYIKDLEGYDFLFVQAYYQNGNNIDIYQLTKPHLTDDTEWSEAVTGLVASIVPESYNFELPFVQLGYQYEISADYAELGYDVIVDYHSDDLTIEIEVALEEAGFEYDEDYQAWYYTFDDGAEFEVFIMYDSEYGDGNSLFLAFYPPIPEYSIAEALALEELQTNGGATEAPVIVSGTIKSLGDKTSYGYKNVVIEDGNGNELTIRTLNIDAEEFGDVTLEVGLEIAAYGYLSNKDGSITMGTYNNTYAYLYGIADPSLQ